MLKDGEALAVDGSTIPMRADCVCVHSDTPNAEELARTVRDKLKPYLN